MKGLEIDLVVDRQTSKGEAFRLQVAIDTGDGITVVNGASGAGKTSLLLAVLGALTPSRGHIALAGRRLYDSAEKVNLPVRRRRIGMVFQDAPLFPHLDVRRNVAFGMQGEDRVRRTRELLERVGAQELTDRRPSELSGGQRQRVALARALAADPAALLLDEPFSALDAPGRAALGELLLELHASTGIPFVHVTHDLNEAVRLGSTLVLLERGAVVQTGSPDQVIARPASLTAARQVGTENLFSGRVHEHREDEGCSRVVIDGTSVLTTQIEAPIGARVALGLRAEEILVSLEPLHRTSARNLLAGTVEGLAPRGPAVELRIATPASFRVLVTPISVRELDLRVGRRVYLLIKATAFHRLL